MKVACLFLALVATWTCCTNVSLLVQEALHREQMLENKLATLQRLVDNTQDASESGWQASS